MAALTAGQRVKHWRELRGIEQQTLAASAKMDNTKLSRIENGHQEPRASEVEALAKALDLTMAEFYGETEAA